jgi:hypothetical protein
MGVPPEGRIAIGANARIANGRVAITVAATGSGDGAVSSRSAGGFARAVVGGAGSQQGRRVRRRASVGIGVLQQGRALQRMPTMQRGVKGERRPMPPVSAHAIVAIAISFARPLRTSPC